MAHGDSDLFIPSAFNQIQALIENGDTSKFVKTVTDALPGASVLFANLMILGSFGPFGLQLSMLPAHGVKMIMSLIQPEAKRTQRMLDEMHKPPAIVWGQTIPPVVFVFLVSLVYMPIVPILEVFALAYFFGWYLVWKHQCLHVYQQEFEGGGDATWIQLFGFLMSSLYVGEFVFVAYMGLKVSKVACLSYYWTFLFVFGCSLSENLFVESSDYCNSRLGAFGNYGRYACYVTPKHCRTY